VCVGLAVSVQAKLRSLLLSAGFTGTLMEEVARGSVRPSPAALTSLDCDDEPASAAPSTPAPPSGKAGGRVGSAARAGSAGAGMARVVSSGRTRARSRPASASLTLPGAQDLHNVTVACVRGVETVLGLGGIQEVIDLRGVRLLVDLAGSGKSGFAEALECLVVIAASEVRITGAHYLQLSTPVIVHTCHCPHLSLSTPVIVHTCHCPHLSLCTRVLVCPCCVLRAACRGEHSCALSALCWVIVTDRPTAPGHGVRV
jgi:hypothetical protein